MSYTKSPTDRFVHRLPKGQKTVFVRPLTPLIIREVNLGSYRLSPESSFWAFVYVLSNSGGSLVSPKSSLGFRRIQGDIEAFGQDKFEKVLQRVLGLPSYFKGQMADQIFDKVLPPEAEEILRKFKPSPVALRAVEAENSQMITDNDQRLRFYLPKREMLDV